MLIVKTPPFEIVTEPPPVVVVIVPTPALIAIVEPVVRLMPELLVVDKAPLNDAEPVPVCVIEAARIEELAVKRADVDTDRAPSAVVDPTEPVRVTAPDPDMSDRACDPAVVPFIVLLNPIVLLAVVVRTTGVAVSTTATGNSEPHSS